MNTTDATLTNGRYELPAHARGVLVLADPPEAGWRLELPPDEEVAPEAEQAAGTPAIVLGCLTGQLSVRGATYRSSAEDSREAARNTQ